MRVLCALQLCLAWPGAGFTVLQACCAYHPVSCQITHTARLFGASRCRQALCPGHVLTERPPACRRGALCCGAACRRLSLVSGAVVSLLIMAMLVFAASLSLNQGRSGLQERRAAAVELHATGLVWGGCCGVAGACGSSKCPCSLVWIYIVWHL